MSTYSYFASQSFGLYRCADWYYDNSVPTWEHTGQTMEIDEFSLDLNNSDEFQACRSGDSIYVRRPTHYGGDDWHEVYSVTAAEAQYSQALADFTWVEINSAPGKEGHMYCQCCEAYNVADKRIFIMKSTDYGITWNAFTIVSGVIRASGGIFAGRVTGDVLYATYCSGAGGGAKVSYSISEGSSGSWAQKDTIDISVWVTRVMIDPLAEAISYAGRGINGPRLYRAPTVDAGYSVSLNQYAGIAIFYGYGGGWISAQDGNYVRTIRISELYFSDDRGATWDSNAVSNVGHNAVFERAMWGNDDYPHWVGVASRLSITTPFVNYHLLKSTQDNGITWYDKAGANADTGTTGGGDSIPHNCGGIAEQGLYLITAAIPQPEGHVYTSVVQIDTLPTAGTVYADGVQMGTIATGNTVYAHGVKQENPRP